MKRRRISIQGTRCQMCPNCKNAQTAKQACYVNILMTFPEFQDRDIIITTMRRLGFSEFGLPPQPVKGATVSSSGTFRLFFQRPQCVLGLFFDVNLHRSHVTPFPRGSPMFRQTTRRARAASPLSVFAVGGSV